MSFKLFGLRMWLGGRLLAWQLFGIGYRDKWFLGVSINQGGNYTMNVSDLEAQIEAGVTWKVKDKA